MLVKDADKKLPLVNAYNEKCFWVHQGPVLSNLKDLLRAFKYMTDVQFNHHVTKEKNDFYIWVENILGDAICAKKLHKSNTAAEAAKVIEERLEDYVTN